VRVVRKEQGVERPGVRLPLGVESGENLLNFQVKNAGFLCVFVAKAILVARKSDHVA